MRGSPKENHLALEQMLRLSHSRGYWLLGPEVFLLTPEPNSWTGGLFSSAPTGVVLLAKRGFLFQVPSLVVCIALDLTLNPFFLSREWETPNLQTTTTRGKRIFGWTL